MLSTCFWRYSTLRLSHFFNKHWKNSSSVLHWRLFSWRLSSGHRFSMGLKLALCGGQELKDLNSSVLKIILLEISCLFRVVVVLEYKIVSIKASGRRSHVVNENLTILLFFHYSLHTVKRTNAITRKASPYHNFFVVLHSFRQTSGRKFFIWWTPDILIIVAA